MKIAIAFFGIPRSTRMSFPSIESNILAHIPKEYDLKFFYHLYDQKEVVNFRSGENVKLDKDSYAPFLKFHGELDTPGYCLKHWDFEKLKNFGDTWNDNFKSLENLIHQLNSLYLVTEFIEDFSPDLVLFLRPDLIYHSKFTPHLYELIIKNKDAAIIPSWQWWGGYNDRFAICGREAYRAYGKRILKAQEFCKIKKQPLNAEELLKFSLDSEKIKIFPENLKASRARANGRVKNESFSPIWNMGGILHAGDCLIKRATKLGHIIIKRV